MEEQLAQPKMEAYVMECKPQYINFLYGILINRISRGWSAEELSFLLGQDENFMADLERFIAFDYGVELMRQLLLVMPEADLLMTSVRSNTESKYNHTISREGDLIRYTMEQLVNEWESITVFELIEEDGTYRDKVASNSVAMELEHAEELLRILISKEYFKKHRTTLDIFNLLRTNVCSHFQPKQLKTELDKLWGRKGQAPLRRTKRRSYGYRFIIHKQ